MNLSMKWLADFTDVSDITIKEYCDTMTLTGSKVEGYKALSEEIDKVVVGKILDVTPHSNSDHLLICKVDIGTETVQIVTGASNVYTGAYVPVALDGSTLPGGKNINKGKLRGEVSEGMLCSIGELNLTTHDMPGSIEDGIFILNDCLDTLPEAGTDITKALMMDDTTVEFEITSNRPDCLSVVGLARESAVSFNRKFNLPELSFDKDANDGDTINNYLKVEIDSPENCYRYSAKVIKNVRIKPSPLWLRMRLRASGVRPINNIVDITNYVMLEYGQPMHAFDYRCLEGSRIKVRQALENEPYVTLDNITHNLKDSMLVIADEKKPVALAGVMGGANSGISDSTATVVFESATFRAGNVRKTAQALGMRTESSSRFEKGLDSENTIPALIRACELVKLLDAGDVVDGLIDVYPCKKEKAILPLETDKINRFLGVDIDKETMKSILSRLEFEILPDDLISVPSFRDDVRTMNDIAEEIIRIFGYGSIVSTVDHVFGTGRRTASQAYDTELRDLLRGLGLNEIQTFSFISPKYYDKIGLSENDERRNSVKIKNPLGEDTSVMRTTAVSSMLEVLSYNNSVKNVNVSLFEFGTVYIPDKDPDILPDERKKIIIGFYENGKNDSEGFYRLKGYIDAILNYSGNTDIKYESTSSENAFHPGRAAYVYSGDTRLGVLGEIHPEVASRYNFTERVYICELDFNSLFETKRKEMNYVPVPKFPAVERDFSFVCNSNMEAGTLLEAIKSAGGTLLESVEVFDVYQGPQLGLGLKSVSFAVQLRDPEKTLTDEDADRISANIIKELDSKLNVKLRS